MMHVGRQYARPVNCMCVAGAFCKYASSDGSDALRRLAKRGLVERVRRGSWHVIEHEEDW
jgi:predicted transcriptional regulator of viral defense system